MDEMTLSQSNSFSSNIIWLSTWLLLRPLLEFFCHFEIKGTENLTDLKKPLIFAVAMHGSRLDPWIVSAGIPFSYNKKFIPIRFMTYYKYIELPIVGPFLKFSYGAYPVEPGKGLEESLKSSINMLRNGEVVGIFPEGGLSKVEGFREAKVGTVYLSAKTNVPILPVYLGGNFDLTFSTFFSFRKRVKVGFGKLLYPKDLFEGRTPTEPADFQRATKLLVDQIANLANL